MDNEILKILLEHKLEFLHTIVNVSMLWWVSAVVFCGSFFVGIWLKKELITQLPPKMLSWFKVILVIFYLSVVGYGFWTWRSIHFLEKDIKVILSKLGQQFLALPQSEFFSCKIGIILGTTSFIFVTVALFLSLKELKKK